MKNNLIIGKNFCEAKSLIHNIFGKKLIYFLDYAPSDYSQAIKIFSQKNVGIKMKSDYIELMTESGENFFWVGVYIKSSDLDAFRDCMRELERNSHFFCKEYNEMSASIICAVSE